jgi:peptidoglycan hydrolase CwlO-like protein
MSQHTNEAVVAMVRRWEGEIAELERAYIELKAAYDALAAAQAQTAEDVAALTRRVAHLEHLLGIGPDYVETL